jgi:hypothetical protein
VNHTVDALNHDLRPVCFVSERPQTLPTPSHL